FLVHEDVTLTAGSLPGPNEVIVGRLVAERLGVDEEAVAIGRTVAFEGGTFKVAGRFAAAGTAVESEIWAPLHELRGLARRDDVSAVFVRCETPEDVADVSVFAQRRLDLELVAIRSDTYYGALAAYFGPIRALAAVMAGLIALSVIVTGANTLGATVRDRAVELATLRAVGYRTGALLRSLLAEATLLAAAGGLVGLVLARIAVHGTAFRIGMSAFALEVGGGAVLVGVCGVVLLGSAGTVPAALRVARISVANSLRPD
ncbi:MAG: ABC transporter permease, partial [Planctomycetota bacterium JB042]